MSFSRVFAIAGRIISQFMRDHRTLGLLFVAPIVVMSIFGYVFRSQEENLIKLALVNHDSPPAGQESLAAPVIAGLKADTEDLAVTEMEDEAAREAVRDGTQRVALIFPVDFTQKLQSERKTSVEVVV